MLAISSYILGHMSEGRKDVKGVRQRRGRCTQAIEGVWYPPGLAGSSFLRNMQHVIYTKMIICPQGCQ